jgi:hypothetical protein
VGEREDGGEKGREKRAIGEKKAISSTRLQLIPSAKPY